MNQKIQKRQYAHGTRLPLNYYILFHHHLKAHVGEEGVGVVEEQHIGDGFGRYDVLDVVVEVSRIYYDYFAEALGQERHHAVGVGVLYEKEMSVRIKGRPYRIHRVVAAAEYGVCVLCVKAVHLVELGGFLLGVAVVDYAVFVAFGLWLSGGFCAHTKNRGADEERIRNFFAGHTGAAI